MRQAKNNKRLILNTVILYLRMLFCMGVSFFTVRVLLNALGVVDYGMISAIEAVASMFGAITFSLSTAASRFFTFELGRDDPPRLKQMFSLILLLYLGAVLFLLILLETVGLWYVDEKLVVPAARRNAAAIFYQIVVCISMLCVLRSPFISLVISHENMKVYSVLYIVENVSKLIIATAALQYHSDRFLFYGYMLLVVHVGITIAYWGYCYLRYPVSHFVFYFSWKDFKSIFSFMSWSIVGHVSWSFNDVFLNLLLNSFFGPVVNATRGIASQVNHAVGMFTENFLTAGRPQIVKYWAAGNRNDFSLILERISKIGFYLLIILAIPVFYEVNYLTELWLHTPPPYTNSFIRLILLTSMINFFSYSIVYAVQATGKIALFESLGSGVRLLVLPFAWFCFANGAPPPAAFAVSLAVTTLCVLLRFIIFCRVTKSPPRKFAYEIFGRMLLVLVPAQIVPLFIYIILPPSIVRMIILFLCSLIWTSVCWFMLGLSKRDKIFCIQFVRLAAARILPESHKNHLKC